MEIYLTRHGQSVGNLRKLLQGQTEFDLTELGISQAQKLGFKLKGTEFDSVYCSDLKRCRQTASEIQSYLNLEPIVDRRLRERNFGDLEGEPHGSLDTFAQAQGVPFREMVPPNGESSLQVMQRCRDFLDDLLQKHLHKEHRVLIVSHSGWISEFFKVLSEVLSDTSLLNQRCSNTGLFHLVLKGEPQTMQLQIKLSNDTLHLFE